MAEPQERDLLADVAAAMDQVETGAEPAAIDQPEPAPAGETAEQKADRVRDEQGRFAKAEEGKGKRETLTLKEKPAEKAAEVAAAPAEQPPAAAKTPADEPIAPPAEWKGAGKVQWNKLPKAVQAELRDTYQGLASERAEYAPLREVIQGSPAWAQASREAGSAVAAANAFGQFYHLFLTNPPQLIHDIARAKGIDLRQLVGQPAQDGGTQQQQPPDINSLVTQTVQQALAPVFGQMQQAENQQLQSTIDAFAQDPAHPYFQDVKTHMGQLLKVGAAKDMQDAYDQATWANPVIRQQLLDAQAEATKQTQAAQVAKARQASAVNLSGSPLAGAVAQGGGKSGESAHDTVRRVMAEMEGA